MQIIIMQIMHIPIDQERTFTYQPNSLQTKKKNDKMAKENWAAVPEVHSNRMRPESKG